MLVSKRYFFAAFVIIFVIQLGPLTRAQEFEEMMPPTNLRCELVGDTLVFRWDRPADWDSLAFDVYRAIVYDTSRIQTSTLKFQKLLTTKDSYIKQKFEKSPYLAHLALVYVVIAVDANSVKSVRSYYFLIRLKDYMHRSS